MKTKLKMKYRKLGSSNMEISVVALGTWAFGSDAAWWGKQDDNDSFAVLESAMEDGINFIDTAPVYGRGHSEEVIGTYINKENIRNKVYIATKVGLSWDGPKVFHNLKPERIFEEIKESLNRLQTDYIDLYQVHWPDQNISIDETAMAMKELYDKGLIRYIGVSNFNVEQMKIFMKYAPIHSLQPPYNMFEREIEKTIIPFCIVNNIGILAYIPLQQGILTGKYFNGRKPVGKFRIFSPDLNGKRLEINRMVMRKIKKVADKRNISLAELAINWVISKDGITSAIVGSRKKDQLSENINAIQFKFDDKDINVIESILQERLQLLQQ